MEPSKSTKHCGLRQQTRRKFMIFARFSALVL
jgi:hypothetical protein